jgi:hypothetical protein
MKHGNKLIALLVLILFCMMSFLPGAAWATVETGSTSTETTENKENSEDETPKLEKPEVLEARLPGLDEELLLRAEAALQKGDMDRCWPLLEACSGRGERWQFLRGEYFFRKKDYRSALKCYRLVPGSRRVYARLEQCCLELSDYKGAYEYAKKQL